MTNIVDTCTFSRTYRARQIVAISRRCDIAASPQIVSGGLVSPCIDIPSLQLIGNLFDIVHAVHLTDENETAKAETQKRDSAEVKMEDPIFITLEYYRLEQSVLFQYVRLSSTLVKLKPANSETLFAG